MHSDLTKEYFHPFHESVAVAVPDSWLSQAEEQMCVHWMILHLLNHLSSHIDE